MIGASGNWTLTLALTAAITASTAGVLATSVRTPEPTSAAGVFPPWWTRGQVAAAAGQAGGIVDFGAVPFIVTVRDPSGRAQSRLRQAGALFSLPPAGSTVCES